MAIVVVYHALYVEQLQVSKIKDAKGKITY